MINLWNILNSAGGLAAIGVLIDFTMTPKQRDRLKSALEDWWVRFDDVRWGNFGSEEAKVAVSILDNWAGDHFWSWQRWYFSIWVNLLAALGGLVWFTLSALRLALRNGESDFLSWIVEWDWVHFGKSYLIVMPILILAFAGSLSLTKAITILVQRVCTGTIFDIALFLALLLLHWFFLVYWGTVTSTAFRIPIVMVDMWQKGIWPWAEYTTSWVSHIERTKPTLLFGWFPVMNLGYYSLPSPDTGYKLIMDFVANGLRLAIAFVFLISFVFRPLIQKPLSWIWLHMLQFGRPIFTMVFGTLGVALALVQQLFK